MKKIKRQQCYAGMITLAVTAWCIISFSAHAATARHTQFKPGEIWTDTSGAPINAHGGGILYHDKVYYWYGEIKKGKTWMPEANRSWNGTRVDVTGISCYSSKDLYNWKNEGNVLPAVKDDPNHDLHTSKVMERPKVLYNRATKKFVMRIRRITHCRTPGLQSATHQRARFGTSAASVQTAR